MSSITVVLLCIQKKGTSPYTGEKMNIKLQPCYFVKEAIEAAKTEVAMAKKKQGKA